MVVKVRRASISDAPAIARVHADTWRTTYKGLMTDEFLPNLSYDRRQRMWEESLNDPKRTTTVLVADDEEGRVIGFAACGAARDEKEYDGELFAIYVTQDWQGRGVGRELLRSAAQDLKARGFGSMLVWVLADNPFRRFYESLGGERVRTRNAEIGGQGLRELGYGWRSLDSLI
jgi:GNAT superfamily N-acetyltransferase